MAKVRNFAGDRIKRNREVLDAMEDPGPAASGGSGSSSDLSAKEEGFRNALDRRLGAEEYDRLGAVGQQDPTEAGDYSAKEVIAEFRNAKKGGYSGVDEGDNSVVDYFKKLQEEGFTHSVFGDTLIAGTVSKRGNKYAEVFATSFGWTRVFPMKKKSEAHEGLSLQFQRDGMPLACIVDRSKEQVEGDFRRKCKEASC